MKFGWSQNISTSRDFSALPSATGVFGNTPRGVCSTFVGKRGGAGASTGESVPRRVLEKARLVSKYATLQKLTLDEL